MWVNLSILDVNAVREGQLCFFWSTKRYDPLDLHTINGALLLVLVDLVGACAAQVIVRAWDQSHLRPSVHAHDASEILLYTLYALDSPLRKQFNYGMRLFALYLDDIGQQFEHLFHAVKLEIRGS